MMVVKCYVVNKKVNRDEADRPKGLIRVGDR